MPGNHAITLDIQTINGCTYSITKAIVIDSIFSNFSLAPAKFCDSGTVSFTNLTKHYSEIDNYEWDFGDGSVFNGNNASHTYTAGKKYTVKLFGITTNGCKDSTIYIDTIKVFELPHASIAGDSIHCGPGIFSYMSVVRAVDNIIKYQWFVDGLQTGSATDLLYNFNAGNHIVLFKITTLNGCTDDVFRNIIVDSVKAAFSISRQKFCGDTGSVQFSNFTTSRFNIVKYEWFFGDNTFSALKDPVHTCQRAGLYDVRLVVTSEHGCTDTIIRTRAVEIYNNPVSSFTGSGIHCSPGIKTYNSNATANDTITQYEWHINGNIAGNAPDLNYDFFPAGIYTVNLKVTTGNGCADDNSRLVIVDSIKTDFRILNPKICGDTGTVRFFNLSTSRFDNNTFLWNFGDGRAAPGIDPVHFYNVPGNYIVSLTATTANGCPATLVSTDTVMIYTKTTAAIMGDIEKCTQNTLVYRAGIQTQDAVISYTWKLNNSVITNADSMSYNFSIAGNYTVGLNLLTKFGCAVTTQKQVGIHP
ncbi:MAG: PKD domain-containing protein, partial [Ferruginibacter sp.]